LRWEAIVEADDATGFGALALVLLNRVDQAAIRGGGAAIVQEENALADAPEWRGAEFVADGGTLGNIVRETRAHVVDEQVGVEIRGLIAERGGEAGARGLE